MKKKLMSSVITSALMLGFGVFSPISLHTELLSKLTEISSLSSLDLKDNSLQNISHNSSLEANFDAKRSTEHFVTLPMYESFANFLDSVYKKLDTAISKGDLKSISRIALFASLCLTLIHNIANSRIREKKLRFATSVINEVTISSNRNSRFILFISHIYDAEILRLKHCVRRIKRTGKKEHAEKFIARAQDVITKVYNVSLTIGKFQARRDKRLHSVLHTGA